MSKENIRVYVTQDFVDQLDNLSEVAFAQAILDKNDKRAELELLAQVMTGGHIIDFLVRNLKRGDSEKFVEVTLFTKPQLDGYLPKPDRRPSPEHKSLFRKHGQMEAMQQSGQSWTILTAETIANLEKINAQHPDFNKRKQARKFARAKRYS